MKRKVLSRKRKVTALICLLAMLGSVGPALADERSDLEQLRATTMALIEALVENGVITREKADKLIRDAEERAKARVAQPQPAAPETKDGKKVVRVPYVPESVRRDISDQVKQEVMAQAKEEGWASPHAVPEWLDRFTFEGDLRLRYDGFRLNSSNTAPGVANYVSGTGLTRAADFVGSNGNVSGVPNADTQENFSRERLRARFGVNVKLSDMTSAGIRISTGSSSSSPTSGNQTLGQGFNKYSLVVDRAFITIQPTPSLMLTGGRIANPFMNTDLVWAEDLSFEGFAASYKPRLSRNIDGFLTAGWFPLRTDYPNQSTSRSLAAAQIGFDWKLSPQSDLKLAAALYQYRNVVGSLETNARYGPPSASDYGTLYEYPSSVRQRGNTLFILNAPADPLTGNTYWGLASEFREFNLTASLDIASFGPNHVVLTGDYVKNLAFDRAAMSQRAGSAILDGKDSGYLAKLLVGRPVMAKAGDWNAFLTYRYLGSDAVVDAYTNSDFGMGGTNSKGYILGASYAFDKRAWVTVRWMGSDLIDSMAPGVAGSTAAPTKLSTDLLQVDLNAKF